MKVEISKKQKDLISEKVALCVAFLKQKIQPHLVSSDEISAEVGPDLTLYITSKELYVKEIKYLSLGIDIPTSKIWYLEKQDKKKAKKFLCDVRPELAVEFLKYWDKARDQLLDEVAVKNTTVDQLNNFIDSFTL